MPDKKLPSVPETILKRRKRQATARAERQKAALADSAARKKKRADIFKRAEKYAKEYRQVWKSNPLITRSLRWYWKSNPVTLVPSLDGMKIQSRAGFNHRDGEPTKVKQEFYKPLFLNLLLNWQMYVFWNTHIFKLC